MVNGRRFMEWKHWKLNFSKVQRNGEVHHLVEIWNGTKPKDEFVL